jgi:hypothetical protein
VYEKKPRTMMDFKQNFREEVAAVSAELPETFGGMC